VVTNEVEEVDNEAQCMGLRAYRIARVYSTSQNIDNASTGRISVATTNNFKTIKYFNLQ